MKLLIQEFLEKKTFQDLISEHGVYASLSKNKKKISLNYDQLETVESDVLAWDCRGLILCKKDHSEFASTETGKVDLNTIVGETDILAYPMKRFFNYGQGAASNINFDDPNIAILEKLDGTCMIVYFDSIMDQWCVATRSVPDANLLMDNGIYTFRTLFDKALLEMSNMKFDTFASYLDKEVTYCFELTSPLNKIVVDYKDKRVTLIAARNIKTHKEINIDKIDIPGIPHVQQHVHMSISELIEWVGLGSAFEHEGVVVRDPNFNRIKVKNPAYCVYSKMRDSLGNSERNCLQTVLLEKDDDVIAFLPQEIADNLKSIKSKVQAMILEHNIAYSIILKEANFIKPNDKKTFALQVQDACKNGKLWAAPMYSIYGGRAENMKDFIAKSKKDGEWPNSFLDKILDIIKPKN